MDRLSKESCHGQSPPGTPRYIGPRPHWSGRSQRSLHHRSRHSQMLLPAPYGVWFPNLCETSLSAVDMEVQLDEDVLILLLLVVGELVRMGACELELAQLYVASTKVTWNVAFPQFVVGRHLFVCHRLVVPVVFPACPLCGSIAAPFYFHHLERLRDHDLHDCHAVLLQSHHAMSLQDHHQS